MVWISLIRWPLSTSKLYVVCASSEEFARSCDNKIIVVFHDNRKFSKHILRKNGPLQFAHWDVWILYLETRAKLKFCFNYRLCILSQLFDGHKAHPILVQSFSKNRKIWLWFCFVLILYSILFNVYLLYYTVWWSQF